MAKHHVLRGTERAGPFHKLRMLLSRKTEAECTVTEDHILSIIAFRRGRDAAFGGELFSDPAWDILLELHGARLGSRRMTVPDLARAINLPQSTAARWISALAEHGLIVSPGGAADHGQLEIELSREGAGEMKRLMDYWGSAFRSI